MCYELAVDHDWVLATYRSVLTMRNTLPWYSTIYDRHEPGLA